MSLIFLAALCSVMVSIILKKCVQHGLNALAMISWNYASAALLCLFWFKPNIDFNVLAHTTWWLIILLGVLLPSIFFLLSQSLYYAGLVKTEIAQRISVVLSLSAAYLVFNEQFSTLKILGIGCGIVAVLLLLWQKNKSITTQSAYTSKKAMLVLLGVWVGYALVDVLLKYNSSLGLGFAVSLNLIFLVAYVVSFLYAVVTIKKQAVLPKNIAAGLLLGILNFANIALYVTAHQKFKDTPSVVFASMNIAVMVFGTLCGIWIFREKMTKLMQFSLIFAVIAIFLMTKALP